MSRKSKNNLERHEAQGLQWQGRPRNFPPIKKYDKAMAIVERHRETLLARFARHNNETVEQTVAAIFSHVIERGLTFDELLWHHFYSGWAGGLTVTERQRQAAFKAWKTIRQRKAEAEDDGRD